ncbi:unnamed protein product, partial [Musa textilis]
NTQTLTLKNFRNKLNIALRVNGDNWFRMRKSKEKGKQELHDRHVVSYYEIYCFFFLIISQLVAMFYFIKSQWDLMACSCCIIQAFLSLKSMSPSLQNTLS